LEQTFGEEVEITMKDESTYQKQNWDWVFALPFIIMILYLFMG